MKCPNCEQHSEKKEYILCPFLCETCDCESFTCPKCNVSSHEWEFKE